MINIIGGKFKRKKINVPNADVRPTSSIKREAIFSILESLALKNIYEIYKDKCFIDLYAGSGAFGLEAISRGASFSYFYENKKEVINILNKNCKSICQKNQYLVLNQDLMELEKLKIEYSLSAIFIDPPYKLNSYEFILKKIIKSNILEKNSIIIMEAYKNISINIPSTLKIIKEKNFGITKLIFIKI